VLRPIAFVLTVFVVVHTVSPFSVSQSAERARREHPEFH